ncbi:roadblock/LC7 domain-containing protein [Streptomyces sp. NPDC058653]|uniref:roadblock/LC7 domain-containing protein n=1 Tax=Streptomyces sp. NPDC058653 TaxID=3346576 RepID=UPI00364A7D70
MTSDQPTADTTDMGWALDALVESQPRIIHAVLFSSDGLLLAKSDGLGRADAEKAAAALSGVNSLQKELRPFCGRSTSEALPVRHVIGDLKGVTVLSFTATARTGVAVSVEGESMGPDAALAITETMTMIKKLKPVLDARERSTGA